jgi:hypothetical protein
MTSVPGSMGGNPVIPKAQGDEMSVRHSESLRNAQRHPNSDSRPYRHTPLEVLFDLIDRPMEDMDVAGRAGDHGAYIAAADAFQALHDEWDFRDAEARR